jgi:hypothetical protein
MNALAQKALHVLKQRVLSSYLPAPSYIRNSWNPNAMALLDNRQAKILDGSCRFSYCSDKNMNGTYEKNHSIAAIKDAVLAVQGIHKIIHFNSTVWQIYK